MYIIFKFITQIFDQFFRFKILKFISILEKTVKLSIKHSLEKYKTHCGSLGFFLMRVYT